MEPTVETAKPKRDRDAPTKKELAALAKLDPAMLDAWREFCKDDERTEEARDYGLNKHAIEDMHTDAEYEQAVVDFVLSKWEDWEHPAKPEANPDYETACAVVREALTTLPFGWYRGNLHGQIRLRVKSSVG